MKNLELEIISEISEENITSIRNIFSMSQDISQARKTLSLEPELARLWEEYRFKTEEANKGGKCLITLSRKDGTGKDIPIHAHLQKIDRDLSYPQRENLPYRHT